MNEEYKKLLKNPLLFFAAFIVFTILHNAVYGLFKIEEPLFFSLALLSLGVSIFLLVTNLWKTKF
jgi:hypothetical protein